MPIAPNRILNNKYKLYTYIVYNAGKLNSRQLKTLLQHYEAFIGAEYLKTKFNDSRSVLHLKKLIIEELGKA